MKQLPKHAIRVSLLALALALAPGAQAADDTKRACVEASSVGQIKRDEGDLFLSFSDDAFPESLRRTSVASTKDNVHIRIPRWPQDLEELSVCDVSLFPHCAASVQAAHSAGSRGFSLDTRTSSFCGAVEVTSAEVR